MSSFTASHPVARNAMLGGAMIAAPLAGAGVSALLSALNAAGDARDVRALQSWAARLAQAEANVAGLAKIAVDLADKVVALERALEQRDEVIRSLVN